MASTPPSLLDQTNVLLETLTQLQANLSPVERERWGQQFNSTLSKVQELNTQLKTHPPSAEILNSPTLLAHQAQLETEMSALPLRRKAWGAKTP